MCEIWWEGKYMKITHFSFHFNILYCKYTECQQVFCGFSIKKITIDMYVMLAFFKYLNPFMVKTHVFINKLQHFRKSMKVHSV